MFRVIYVAAILLVLSCSHPSTVQSIVVSTERPEYAKGFTIELLSDSGYRITLLNPEKSGDTLGIIAVPKIAPRSIACLSTTHIAMIDKLGKIETLKGVSFADRIKNPGAKAAFSRGEIKNLSTDRDLDAEILIGLKPEILFVYPFGGEDYSKYSEMGITVVPVSEYMENHPLGRAEWIKVFGLILGEKQKADSVYSEIASRYSMLTESIKSNTAQRPSVFTGFYDNGDWYAPAGNGFVAKFIDDAGADYIYRDTSHAGNLKIPFEKLYQKVYDTDIWVKIFYSEVPPDRNMIAGEDPRLVRIKSFRENRLYFCNTANNDYFGDAIMEPDVLLADLIYCFHPELLPERKNKYYQKIED